MLPVFIREIRLGRELHKCIWLIITCCFLVKIGLIPSRGNASRAPLDFGGVVPLLLARKTHNWAYRTKNCVIHDMLACRNTIAVRLD